MASAFQRGDGITHTAGYLQPPSYSPSAPGSNATWLPNAVLTAGVGLLELTGGPA